MVGWIRPVFNVESRKELLDGPHELVIGKYERPRVAALIQSDSRGRIDVMAVNELRCKSHL